MLSSSLAFGYQVDVKFYSVMDVGHGFMGLYLPLNHGIPEVKVVVQLLIDILKSSVQYSTKPVNDNDENDPVGHLSKNKIE